MDKYRRVDKPKAETEIKENEIRITTQGKIRNFISYATTLFKEKECPEVILKAMGRAINKTVTIAEIIKRRIAGLHQITEISSTDITDVWEPLEEGLDRLETTRHVSSITIILSKKPLDTSAPGYQPPLPEDQVKEIAFPPTKEELGEEGETGPAPRRGSGGRRGRGRPRRGRGGQQGQAAPQDERVELSRPPRSSGGRQQGGQQQQQQEGRPARGGRAPRGTGGRVRGGRSNETEFGVRGGRNNETEFGARPQGQGQGPRRSFNGAQGGRGGGRGRGGRGRGGRGRSGPRPPRMQHFDQEAGDQ